MKRKTAARFEAKTIPEPNSGCWLWTGFTNQDGYGWFNPAGKPMGAHRVAWMLYRGDPGDMTVCHKCDTPSCVNPDHLWLGTQGDNIRDCFSKGRGNPGRLRGEQHGTAKLTARQVAEIRAAPHYYGVNRDLAARFDVNAQYISRIRCGRGWADV
jgi:hypothetical protein